MTRTGRQLLNTIEYVLKGTPLPEEMHWEKVWGLAAKHHLTGFLYYAMKGREDVPVQVRQAAEKKHLMYTAQQVQQNVYAQGIFAALQEKGIRYMPLKANWFRPLYPTPDLRFSSDIDFYFDPSHQEEVKRIMQEAGFELKMEYVQNFIYENGVVTMEPHFAIAESERDVAYFGDVWERATTEDGVLYRFSDEDIYIYHLLHTYKHMLEGGAGVRSIIDTWLWNRNKPQMDREYLAREYEKLGIAKFASAIEHLSHVWFDHEEMDEDAECLTRYILLGGAYGTKSQKAQMEYVGSADQKALKKAKRKYLLRRLFPTFEELCRRYPILKKCSLLLPFVWLWRLISTVFTPKRARIETMLDAAQSMQGENAERIAKVKSIIGADM